MGRDFTLADVQRDYDAVFLGFGLAGVNALRAAGEEQAGVMDAVEFIAGLRQAKDKAAVPVGRDVVVIGGGMTAVDAAVQSKLLGAENVTIVYRRGQERMSASGYEQEHAAAAGVRIIHNAAPVAVHGNGAVAEVEFAYTEDTGEGLKIKAETFRLKADQLFKAIGQTLVGAPEGLMLQGGKIATTGAGRTSVAGVCLSPHRARHGGGRLGGRRLRGRGRGPDGDRRGARARCCRGYPREPDGKGISDARRHFTEGSRVPI